VRDELFALGGLFALGVAYKLVVLNTAFVDDSQAAFPLITALPGWFDTFAVGMAIAVLSVWVTEGDGRSAAIAFVERRPWLPWAVAAAAFAVLGALELPERPMVLVEHELKALIAAGIVLPAVFGDPSRGWVRRVLAWPPLLWIGLVSYGFFLWHLAVIEEVDGAWGSDIGEIGVTVVSFVVTCAIAAVSWYGLERPIMRWGRRLTGPTAQTRTLADDMRWSRPRPERPSERSSRRQAPPA
jgi:peptidoglycan/LPS O-acetylase OafA/YrhL